jgi:hypothetical protein
MACGGSAVAHQPFCNRRSLTLFALDLPPLKRIRGYFYVVHVAGGGGSRKGAHAVQLLPLSTHPCRSCRGVWSGDASPIRTQTSRHTGPAQFQHLLFILACSAELLFP